MEECLDKIGESINLVHQKTKTVMTGNSGDLNLFCSVLISIPVQVR